jgi:hypothetical protein
MVKKSVNSQNVEFGYELISVIPYAYYLSTIGELKETISGIGSEPFYYFSPKHTINTKPRSWYNVENLETPNKWIHGTLDMRQFYPPPYRLKYANKKYYFDLVVYNRYNNEWPGVVDLNRPINFFSLDLLEYIFKNFEGNILYCNIEGNPLLYDDAEALIFNDRELIEGFENVTHVDDLSHDYNTAQLLGFANCPLFLTMNGGGSILSSYFGGKNIIYTNPVQIGSRIYPREDQTKDFEYYHVFGGSKIIHVNSYELCLKELGL